MVAKVSQSLCHVIKIFTKECYFTKENNQSGSKFVTKLFTKQFTKQFTKLHNQNIYQRTKPKGYSGNPNPKPQTLKI